MRQVLMIVFTILAVTIFTNISSPGAQTTPPPPEAPPDTPDTPDTPNTSKQNKHDPLVRPARIDETLWRILLQLDRHASKIKTFKAAFVQHKYTALLKRPLVSSGLVFMKGDRIFWDTKKPQPSNMWVGGNVMKIYYPEDKLLEIYTIDKVFGHLAASPVAQLKLLVKHFEISQSPAHKINVKTAQGKVKHHEPDRADVILLHLIPKSSQLKKHIEKIDVQLNLQHGFITQITVVDRDGDRSVLTFSHVELNKPIEERILTMRVPADVQVSDLSGD